MELTSLATQRYDIGRAAVFVYGHVSNDVLTPAVWDGSDALFANLHHLGNTEGEVVFEANPENSDLTIEATGPAILKRYLSGESPEFELGVYPNPENMRIFSPTGFASAGVMRRRRVREQTIVVIPEELFVGTDENGNPVEVPLTYVGGEFLKDGDPLTNDEQDLADMITIGWKATFGRATPAYRHEDGGKSLRTVPVAMLQDFDKPNGAQLWLVMFESEIFDVNLEGGS